MSLSYEECKYTTKKVLEQVLYVIKRKTHGILPRVLVLTLKNFLNNA